MGKGLKVFLGILAAAFLIVLGSWFALFRWNRFSLELTLSGEENMTLEYGQSYEEPGAWAVVRGTHFAREGFAPTDLQIETQTNLDEKKLGRYQIVYSARYLGCTAQAKRQIRIVDTVAPEIILTPDDPEALLPDTVYEEAGFSARDNYDGDITDRVVRKEEPGLVTYAVTDSSGNPAFATREIPFRDTIPPEIRLSGGEHYAMPLGKPYEEPGFTATDDIDGDLTQQVVTAGTVDWLNPGVYPITYSVTDSKDNLTEVTRQVEVVVLSPPDTNYPDGKAVYLTFDDGPSAYTKKLLDTLDRYGAKATFFVVGTGDAEMMRKIVDRGHSIGIHSMSHDYGTIYASPEAFFADLWQTQDVIRENTGVETTIMRFPGGSSNEVSRKSCKGIMTYLTGAVQAAGLQYFDWNVYSGDAGETQKTSEVAKNVIEGIQEQRVSLVLQHDIHGYSVEAVEDILRWGTENGYQFLPLSPDSPAFHHDLNN